MDTTISSQKYIFYGEGPDFCGEEIQEAKKDAIKETNKLSQLKVAIVDCRKMIFEALKRSKNNDKETAYLEKEIFTSSNLWGTSGFAVACLNRCFKKKFKFSDSEVILHQAATTFPNFFGGHAFVVVSLEDDQLYLIDLVFRQFLGRLWLSPQEAEVCDVLLKKGYIKITTEVMEIYRRVIELSCSLPRDASFKEEGEGTKRSLINQIAKRKKIKTPEQISKKSLLMPTHKDDFSTKELLNFSGYFPWEKEKQEEI